MKNFSSVVLGLCLMLSSLNAQSQTKWSKTPFDNKVFIENAGQCDNVLPSETKVLYIVQFGNIKAYFTQQGIVYRYEKFRPHQEGQKEDDEIVQPEIKYMSVTWTGANPNVIVEAGDKQDYAYTYAGNNGSTIKTNVFKKLVYRNIYLGIDAEYIFPQGNKTGIKYSLIVHPGADISKVELAYNTSGNLIIDNEGEVIIGSDMGSFTDHAPISYYKDGGYVGVSYSIENKQEKFSVGSYDKSKELIIDPWTTNPKFDSLYNSAYDVNYDNAGNVYAYGSYNPFQLAKLSPTGKVLWIYNAFSSDPSSYDLTVYGGFTVDKITGTSYLGEGFNYKGALAEKVNTNGTLLATLVGDSTLREMWRLDFLTSTRQVIIGGGGTNTPSGQAAILDTNMLTLTTFNPLVAPDGCHDVCLMALDPSGNTAYMAIAGSSCGSGFNNVLISLPIPSITPANYQVSDGYTFQEVGSVNYVGNSVGTANSMNGMAASQNWLYMYDGDSLKRIDKATGARIGGLKISSTQFSYGGLAADTCDNVYVGANSNVKIYNSSFVLQTTIPMASTVYGLSLAKGLIYACGMGFVSATPINDSCFVPTAISQQVENNSIIKVSPNPSNGQFTFDLQGVNERAVVTIFNVLGEEVYTSGLNANSNQVDISKYAKGIYLYKVMTEKGKLLATGKLITQ